MVNLFLTTRELERELWREGKILPLSRDLMMCQIKLEKSFQCSALGIFLSFELIARYQQKVDLLHIQKYLYFEFERSIDNRYQNHYVLGLDFPRLSSKLVVLANGSCDGHI